MKDNVDANTDGIKLVSQLGATDEEQRTEAAQQLELRGLNTIAELQAILGTAHTRRLKLLKLFRVGEFVLFFALCFLHYLCLGHLPGFGWSLFLLFLTSFLSSFIQYSIHRRFRRGMAAALSKFEDARLIGSLLYVYRGESEAVVRPALIRSLQRLKPSDGAWLSEHAREKLYEELACCYGIARNTVNEEFILSILKAFEQVGNDKAIKPVEKVAVRAKNARIRQAAQDCLVFLQAQAAAGRHTLLRAADEDGGELLRAATGSEGQEQTLLRGASDQQS